MTSDADSLFKRLAILAREAGSVSALARMCGIPQRTMAGYVAGEREPRASDIMGIARKTDVSLDWLLAGAGPMRRRHAAGLSGARPGRGETDGRLIGRLTEKIMTLYKEMGVAIALHQAAERAVEEHNRIVAEIDDPDERLIQIGEVVAALRLELRSRTTHPASGKHRA